MAVITVHCGRAGVRWGLSCWERFLTEHGLSPDGRSMISGSEETTSSCGFFQEMEEKHYRPRAVLVDTDGTLTDQLEGRKTKSLFERQVVVGNIQDDCGSIFGKWLGSATLNRILEKIRLDTEEIDVQGFVIFHSAGGGAGSGLSSSLITALREHYPTHKIFSNTLLPGLSTSISPTEPYNVIFTLQNILNSANCCFMFDNDVTFEICRDKLKVPVPCYDNMNLVLSRAVSDLTYTIRFPSGNCVNMADMESSLIPVPRFKFPLTSLSPLDSEVKVSKEADLITDCFDKSNRLLNCDLDQGLMLASNFIIRGKFEMSAVTGALSELKASPRYKFAKSVLPVHKMSLSSRALPDFPDNGSPFHPTRICSLVNSTALHPVFSSLKANFDSTYSMKAFIHWYCTKGIEEQQFEEAIGSVKDLIAEYKYYENNH